MRWAVVVAALAIAGPAAAQNADPETALAELRESLLYARYEEAVSTVDALLRRDDLTASQRNQALEARAIAQLALESDEAEATLRALYARDPGHRLADADASPTVQSAFARVRESHPDTVPVRLLHEPLGTLANRESPRIMVEIPLGADAVEELRLAYRTSGESRFDTAMMRRVSATSAEALIPIDSARREPYVVEYFVEALAPSRTVIAEAGSREEPFRLTVPAPAGTAPILVAPGEAPAGRPSPRDEGGGVLSQWWFWGAVVLVVGGGAAAYVLLGPPSEGPTEGTFGTATLSLR